MRVGIIIGYGVVLSGTVSMYFYMTCGEAGQLGDGCKYLYCRCKGHFCAPCGVKLTESEHFTHFLNAPYGDKCLNKS
jgi:hypothetical protein